ncbi:phosphate ABC transporter ATP-binding protein [Sporosarcina sp. FSL W7-1349]|uniref:ABC transporter ATP-binding protein n=1 Tax=Sporosarcina sp. FSL W7-1349 TaxID=2921561 RepID=UPI0030F962A3
MEIVQNSPSDEPALQLRDVSYSTEGIDILRGVTGPFRCGEITTLVGPSGAGKTTLLKLCNGLVSPTGGNIYVEGREITHFSPTELRRHVGIVLQNSPMTTGSVLDNIALPLRLKGQELSAEEAVDVLEQVGLDPDFIHRDANGLSGGQRQKVSIARTLLNDPQILLLDEITSALDPSSVREIEALIRKLNTERGITVIWITHNFEQAKRMAHSVWVMVRGELVQTGEISLLEKSSNPMVDRFVNGVSE